MPARAVAVVTPYPTLKRGLVAALADSGFAPQQPDDPLVWLSFDGNRAVLLASDRTRALRVIVDLRLARHDLVLVALFADPTESLVRRALLAGACSVAGWDVPSNEVATLLEAGFDSLTVIPTKMARRLALSGKSPVDQQELTARQVGWLRALAGGATVCDLAEQVGYSERAMYRLLRGLYDRVGARNRTQALVWAARHGVVD